MQIKMKSNRIFLVKLYFPLFIFTAVFTIIMLGVIIFGNDRDGLFGILIGFIALTTIEIGIMILAKFYNGRSYIFTEEKISVLNKDKYLFGIAVHDIEEIKYFCFKFRYIITIYAGALNEGGVWKLHITFRDGTKKTLAFFSKKDAIKLKELYNDLIVIR